MDIADNLDRAVESVPKEYKEGTKDEEAYKDVKKVGNVLDGLLAGVVMTQEYCQKVIKYHHLKHFSKYKK